MLLFIRAKYLTEYVVYKHLGMKISNNHNQTSKVGDKLHKLCMEVLITSRSSLEEFLPNVVFSGDKKSQYPSIFFSMMKKVLNNCHMGRVILVFNSCLICCEYCQRNKEPEDLTERFILETANAIFTQKDWIMGNDFTKVLCFSN